MYDNITIFYKDAEILITPFSAGRVIKLLEKRIANGEETAQNYTFLADAYSMKKDSKKAFKYILKAKKIDPDYYYADVVAIIILKEEGKYSKAEYYVNDLLEKAPEDYYFAATFAAVIYTTPVFRERKRKFVQKLAEKILAHEDDGSFKYLNCCIFVYQNILYDFDMTFKYCVKAFKRNPIMMLSLEWLVFIIVLIFQIIVTKLKLNITYVQCINLTKFFMKKEEYYYFISDPYNTDLPPEKMIECIDKAIKINPLPQYRIRKGEILFAIGEHYQETIDILKDVLEEDSCYKECYKIISLSYLELEDYPNALRYINLAILNSQDDEYLYELKSKILKYLNKPDEALNVLLKFYENYPDDMEIEDNLALEYEKRGEHNKALSFINKSLLKEKTSDKYQGKATILFRLERYEDAINAAEKSLELEENGAAYYWMALAYGRLEQYSKALTAINKSILLDGGDMWSYKIQSEILGALGNSKAAEKAYKKARELGLDE